MKLLFSKAQVSKEIFKGKDWTILKIRIPVVFFLVQRIFRSKRYDLVESRSIETFERRKFSCSVSRFSKIIDVFVITRYQAWPRLMV